MTPLSIALLVEGDGETKALPALLRRLIASIDIAIPHEIPDGFRHQLGSIKREGGLERALNTLAALYPTCPILVLIDSDEHCPVTLGTELLRRAKVCRPDLDIAVVIAQSEYESWFVAAAESVAGCNGLRADFSCPPDHESTRDAKKVLTRGMIDRNRGYNPTQDQVALTHQFDLHLARERSRSFKKLWKEVERLVSNHAATYRQD